MDSSGVLLALEEQRKWRDRRKRIEERMKQIDRRRGYLLRELEHARRRLSEYARMLSEPPGGPRMAEPRIAPPSLLR
ncbi:MAG: hypothetical protein ACT4OI_07715 [Methanobacteriota archaeon]